MEDVFSSVGIPKKLTYTKLLVESTGMYTSCIKPIGEVFVNTHQLRPYEAWSKTEFGGEKGEIFSLRRFNADFTGFVNPDNPEIAVRLAPGTVVTTCEAVKYLNQLGGVFIFPKGAEFSVCVSKNEREPDADYLLWQNGLDHMLGQEFYLRRFSGNMQVIVTQLPKWW